MFGWLACVYRDRLAVQRALDFDWFDLVDTYSSYSRLHPLSNSVAIKPFSSNTHPIESLGRLLLDFLDLIGTAVRKHFMRLFFYGAV